ncbi:MAG: hypothetical protein KDB69_02510 [Acidimicrobiia bacterium]|nr:hypothetical protein [Acidimicrobiia bacterium]
MTYKSHSPITSVDVIKLILGLALLAWAAFDWQSYSAAVTATLGAGLVWSVSAASDVIVSLLGLGPLGRLTGSPS